MRCTNCGETGAPSPEAPRKKHPGCIPHGQLTHRTLAGAKGERHISVMLYEPSPYRWQDHVISPRRTAASLMATAAVALVFGSALAFACVRGGGAAAPPDPPPVAHAAVSESTPPLCQLAKRPGAPQHAGRDLL